MRDGQSLYLNIIRASRSGLWVIPWHYGNKYRHVGNVGNKASCPPVFFCQGHFFQAQRTHLWQVQMYTNLCTHISSRLSLPSFLSFFFFSFFPIPNVQRDIGVPNCILFFTGCCSSHSSTRLCKFSQYLCIHGR